jgi:transposase InsO family protein
MAAAAMGVRILKTPVRAPKANAVCERLVGTIRREGRTHPLFLMLPCILLRWRWFEYFYHTGSKRPLTREITQ